MTVEKVCESPARTLILQACQGGLTHAVDTLYVYTITCAEGALAGSSSPYAVELCCTFSAAQDARSRNRTVMYMYVRYGYNVHFAVRT